MCNFMSLLTHSLSFVYFGTKLKQQQACIEHLRYFQTTTENNDLGEERRWRDMESMRIVCIYFLFEIATLFLFFSLL